MERRKRRKKKKKKRRRRRRKRRQMTPYICRICCEILKKYLKQRFFSIISWKEESKRKNEGKCFSFLCICFVFFSFSFIFILFFCVSREEEHPKIGGFSVSCDLFLWVFLCGGGEKGGGGGSFFLFIFFLFLICLVKNVVFELKLLVQVKEKKKNKSRSSVRASLLAPPLNRHQRGEIPGNDRCSRNRLLFSESVALSGIVYFSWKRLLFLETRMKRRIELFSNDIGHVTSFSSSSSML